MKKVWLLGICILFVFVLQIYYFNYSQKIPYSYFDEVWWISDSRFTEYLAEGRLKDPVWDTTLSKDQPMLTRYIFGLWLYPTFLNESLEDDNIAQNFTRFLIINGFTMAAEDGQDKEFYEKVKKDLPEIDRYDYGTRQELVSKYGPSVQKTLNIIDSIRYLNSFFLAVSTVTLLATLAKFKGVWYSGVFTFFYGFNSLLLQTSLKAHSEAIFLALFNLSLALIVIYVRKPTLINCILASLCIGLTMSTKLNGIMLYFALVTLAFTVTYQNGTHRLSKFVKQLFVSGTLVFVIFISLNPYTYKDPIGRAVEMYKYRYDVATDQQEFAEENRMKSPSERILQIHKRFYAGENSFTNTVFWNNSTFVLNILFLAVVFGLLLEVKRVYYGLIRSKFSALPLSILIAFITTITCMSVYLLLDWERYYVPLVSFIIYYTLCGVEGALKFLQKHLTNKTYSQTSSETET